MPTTSRFTPGPNQDNTFRTVTQDYKTPAFAASIKITTTEQDTLVVPAVLTGAVTFTADVTLPYVGDKMRFLLKSDATGRVATFGTGFSSAGTLTLASSKEGYIDFIFNGAAWVEMGRALTA
jgi:hypoxanthine-guanine phosphoribosyltransferase